MRARTTTTRVSIAQAHPRLGPVDSAIQLLAFLVRALVIFFALSVAGLATAFFTS